MVGGTLRGVSRQAFVQTRVRVFGERQGRSNLAAQEEVASGEHPTANIEHPTSNEYPTCGYWMFDVGCWMLDVFAVHREGCILWCGARARAGKNPTPSGLGSPARHTQGSAFAQPWAE